MSDQLVNGSSWLSPVAAKNAARASLKLGMPVSRARAMFNVGKSSGKPTKLLRRASVTNSSISLPVWRVSPRMTAPVAAAVSTCTPPSVSNARGLRKAAINPCGSSVILKSSRSTDSFSIECPKRYTTCANSATMEGSISGELENMNGSMLGCTARANSSNTKCWYCISLTKRAAWNNRSPSQFRAAMAAGSVGITVISVASHSLMVARSLLANTVSL